MRRIFLLYTILLIHLQATAGELIHIMDSARLKPLITVMVSNEEVALLKKALQDNAKAILGMYMLNNGMPADIAVAGRYELRYNKLSFSPLDELGYGLDFEVQYKNAGHTEVSRFSTPANPTSKVAAHVVTTYPLSEAIPYNALFFHIRFSQPMMQDKEAYRHIKLYNDKGEELSTAWRQKSFWLDDGKLLVLMIHPGRVKRGIHYLGSLFDSGKRYQMVVDKSIKDANGNEIADNYSIKYLVKGEDRTSPKVIFDEKKTLHVNTKEALSLSFNESMDYASVFDKVKVLNDKGAHVPAVISITDDSHYKIIPDANWQKGKYTLVLNSGVYDFAGNRINRLFEIADERLLETDKLDMRFTFEVK